MRYLEISEKDIPDYDGLIHQHCGFCKNWQDESCANGFKPKMYYCPEKDEDIPLRKSCVNKEWEVAKDIETNFVGDGFLSCVT